MPRSKPRLLFISNLFPDHLEPYRGLDNATVLKHLSDRWNIRVLALRPTLPFQGRARLCRPQDADFQPLYVPTSYIPKIGHGLNPLLMEQALSGIINGMQRDFDVVLSSWIYPDSCAVARLSRSLRFPMVAIAQGSDVHQYLKIPQRRLIIQRELAMAKSIITRSAELARLLKDVGFPNEQLHPIYNGIDFATFNPGDRAAAREALELPQNSPVILFVGNFYPIKNPMMVVDAHARILADPATADTRLVMAGGGPLIADVQLRAEELGSISKLRLTGRLDSAGIARCMQAADVLVLPSENEGVPNVILEAFATGIPVVASRVGGIPEVHAGAGFGGLFPLKDLNAFTESVRDVLLNPPPRQPIAEHGASFTWERTANAYHELLMAAKSA